MAIEIIKKLKQERKTKLTELFSKLNHINLMEGSQRLLEIGKLNQEKAQLEKYYFTTITNMLLTNRDFLMKKLQNPNIANREKLQKELHQNDELAKEFEAELLQEKLLLKNFLRLSEAEVSKIKSRLNQLGYKVDS